MHGNFDAWDYSLLECTCKTVQKTHGVCDAIADTAVPLKITGNFLLFLLIDKQRKFCMCGEIYTPSAEPMDNSTSRLHVNFGYIS